MSLSRLFVGVALATTLCQPVQRLAAQQLSCGPGIIDSAGGVIYGQVVNDSTGAPVSKRAVFLTPSCISMADTGGKFRFHDLRPGEYKVYPGALGIRRFTPITVNVVSGESTYVEIRLRPENRIADCREIAECNSLLERFPPSSLADSIRLRESALRTSVAILLGESWKLGEFYTCIGEPNADIAQAISQAVPKVVPVDQCEMGDSRAKELRGRKSMSYQGQKAVAVYVFSIVSQQADRATARVGNHVADLWAAGWICEFRREKREWIPISCRMEWIS